VIFYCEGIRKFVAGTSLKVSEDPRGFQKQPRPPGTQVCNITLLVGHLIKTPGVLTEVAGVSGTFGMARLEPAENIAGIEPAQKAAFERSVFWEAVLWTLDVLGRR
jgi:hypothetical protein